MYFITFKELADRITEMIDTVRRAIRRLDLTFQKEKPSSSKETLVFCLNILEANELLKDFRNRNKPIDTANSSSKNRFCYCYIIQLLPETLPNRVKIGYSDNLNRSLREHQTAAPTAKYLGNWRCKKLWNQAAIDSITRTDCRLIRNGTYEGDIEGFVKRANDFFNVMPKDSLRPKLSDHSLLKKNE